MEAFDQIIERFKIPLVLSILGLVLVIGGVVTSGFFNKPKAAPKEIPKQSIVSDPSPLEVKVDVSGAVNNPGVYTIASDSRVEDAVKAAGGFSEDANAESIAKSINLSQKITDGSKIYIPFKGEMTAVVTAGGGGVVAGAIAVKININTSTESDLDSLPGVGPVTAQKIISGRPYNSIDDLKDKKVVSSATFTKIKDQITVN